jgi:hypothetical protein
MNYLQNYFGKFSFESQDTYVYYKKRGNLNESYSNVVLWGTRGVKIG